MRESDSVESMFGRYPAPIEMRTVHSSGQRSSARYGRTRRKMPSASRNQRVHDGWVRFGFAWPSTIHLVSVHSVSKITYGTRMSVITRAIWRLPGASDFEK